MKKIIFVIIGSIFTWSIFAQVKTNEDAALFFTKKISVGLDVGFLPLNYNQPLEKVMKDQGFDAIAPCLLFCSGNTKQPHSNTMPYVGIDVSYLLKPNREVGLRTSIWNEGETKGYHEKYGYLFVKYKELSFTPYYRFTDASRIVQLDVGASANFIKFMREDAGSHLSADNNYFRPGVMVGGNFGILEKKNYYLRLSGQFHLLFGDVDVGPYENKYIEDGEWFTETGFQEEKIGLQKMLVFLSYGRKF